MTSLQSVWESFPNVTEIIRRSEEGDRGAEAELLSFGYPYFRRVAAQIVGRFRSGPLESDEILHEAWMHLRDRRRQGSTRDRHHYIEVLRRAIRHRVISNHRKQTAAKRDGEAFGRSFPEYRADELPKETVVALYQQLDRLAEIEPMDADVVSMLYELGCTLDETAELLGVSVKVVRTRWKRASQWLKERLS